MDWGENLFHHHLDEPCNFLQSSDEYFNAQDMSFLIPLAAKRKLLFETGSVQMQGSEAELPWQTCQNQPEQAPMQAISRPAGKLNSETRGLTVQKVNVLPNETESESCNLKGKDTLGSKTPVTPIERKRINDQNYRRRKREEKQNLQEENKNLHEEVQRLSQEKAQLKDTIEQLICRIDQPKSSILKCKAKFQLNCHDEESKKEAMNLVFDNFPGIDSIQLKRGKRILELKGSFDAEVVLRMLNRVCDTHLLSKKNVPSGPGPSKLAYLSVSAVKLR